MTSINDDGSRDCELHTLQRLRRVNAFPCISARYALAMLSFLGFFNVYALRVNLSVAIVQMENDTAQHYPHAARTFTWSNNEEGWILAAFFYGYILTQIPGGWLAQRYGGKWVFGVGILMTSVFTLFTPLAAMTSLKFLITVRVLEGFFEGVTYPAMHAMWGHWAPPQERTRLAAISYTGPYVGNVLSFPVSALLCQYGFDGGWPSVFYVFGGVGTVWFIFWALLAHSTPAQHPRISPAERDYILSSLATENNTTKLKMKTPWFSILTSPPVWAIVVCYFCNNWGFYTLLTCIPTFIKQTLGCNQHMSIVLNGVYSAIPYVSLSVVTLLSGPTADYIRAHWLSTTITRKIFTVSALTSAATFLLLCGYLGNSTPVAITLLTIAVGIGGLIYGGHCVNHLDIGASHAGVLMGLTNMFGTIPGFVGPQVAKLIAATPNVPKCSPEYISILREEWRQVLIIAAEVYITGALIYAILASGKTQVWAITDDVITTSSTTDRVDGCRDNKEGETVPFLSASQELNGVK